MSELAIVEENEDSVIDMYLKGMNPTQISKHVSMQRKDVIKLITQWREAVNNDTASRDVARDALNKMVEHYDRLIKRFYDLVEDIDKQILTDNNLSPQMANQKRGTLDSVAALEAKRVDLLQKAGIMDNSDLGDELAKMEEDKKMILDILRYDLCPVCKPSVMDKIGQMTGRVEVVVVSE